MTYEIELRALLTEEKYKQLLSKFSAELKLIEQDTVHTTRYSPGDIRFRSSNKMMEIVQKQGDPTKLNRKEKVTPVKTKKEFEARQELLKKQGYKAHPSWVKHKAEFHYPYKGFDYLICLQHIEKFAHILEVEFMSKESDSGVHAPNIKAIIREFNLEPVEPKKFMKMIYKYRKVNKTV